ncbi:MAG: hypothetical protein OXG24_12140 [Gammaproteobacteria bacterium]|nr:hypothetical protein [Gammaproteobacteria bacterium]
MKLQALAFLGLGICVIALLVGVTPLVQELGWHYLIGRNAPDSATTGTSISKARDSNSPATSNESVPPVSLLELARTTSTFERNAKLHAMLAKANEKQVVDLLDKSHEIASVSRRQDIQQVIFRRLTAFNPVLAIEKAKELPNNLQELIVAAIFAEWSSSIDDAVAHALTLSTTDRSAALRGILGARDDMPEIELIQIGRRLGNEQLVSDRLMDSQSVDGVQNYAAMWSRLTSDSRPDISQVGELIRIANAWIDQDGLTALDQISASLNAWETQSTVLSSVLHRIAKPDARAAFDFALTLDNDHNSFLLSLIAQYWANDDPESAMAAINQILPGVKKRYVIESVVRSWAEQNPHTILSGLDLVPENYQVLAKETAVSEISKTAPREAVELLKDLESSKSRRVVAFEIAANWSKLDARAALEWVLNSSEVSHMKKDLLSPVLSTLATRDPQLAFETALQEPMKIHEIGLESTVVSYIAWSDVEQALQLLDRVRAGKTKFQSFSAVGAALVRQNDSIRALELGEKLPSTDRQAYRNAIVNAWSRHNPVDLLNSLAHLPSNELKSTGAYFLIASNPWQRALTDAQVDIAKEFLSEDALDQLRQLTTFNE